MVSDQNKILSRAHTLCSLFVMNLSYYRAGHDHAKMRSNFIRAMNGNFLDVAVLEWCKLFADKKSPYCWRNLLNEEEQKHLLESAKLNETIFENYKKSIKSYRDKFVAHLDKDLDGQEYPNMDYALSTTKIYYDYLKTKRGIAEPHTLDDYEKSFKKEALIAHQKLAQTHSNKP